MEVTRRFDDELSIARGLVELKRQGVALDRLEAELTRLGPVDLDLLGRVRHAMSVRIGHATVLAGARS